MSLAIEVDNVTKIYKTYNNDIDRLKEVFFNKKYSKDFYALKDVSFKISKGEFVGIVGRNGAGKSTILKIISGITKPTTGNVRVYGKISAILELSSGFNTELTGLDNIYLKGTLMGFSKAEVNKHIDSIIEFADIGEHIHKPVRTYSSGMLARLAFAIAINMDADILIVDEALAVGDTEFKLKCYKKFNEYKDSGKTILFVTHSMSSILNYCTRAILLDKGRKIDDGTPKEIVDLYKKITTNSSIKKDMKSDDIYEDIEEKKAWKDCFNINSNAIEYGDKKVEIIDFGLFTSDGQISHTIMSNELMLIKLRVKIIDEVKEPIFAFSIKDIKGLELIGTNTLYENIDVSNYNKIGSEIIITFEQKLSLRPGNYTLSLGCTEFVHGKLVVHHRLYDILIFEVLSDKQIPHLFDANSKINIRLV